jgi:hypothetical protein
MPVKHDQNNLEWQNKELNTEVQEKWSTILQGNIAENNF